MPSSLVWGVDSNAWLVIGTFIGSFGAIVTSLFTIRYAKIEHERETLGLIYNILSDPAHRIAARNVLQAHRDDTTVDEKDAELVARNYDKVAQFVEINLVPKKKYYKMFGRSTVIQYVALKNWISAQRQRADDDIMASFTDLSTSCMNYWDGRIKDPKTRLPIKMADLASPTTDKS